MTQAPPALVLSNLFVYPCEPDVPFPIAKRTREYLNSCGLGPFPQN